MARRLKDKRDYFSFSLIEIIGYEPGGDTITEEIIFSVQAEDYESACDKAFEYADSITRYQKHDTTLYDNNGDALYDYDESRCEWQYAG